MKKVSLFLALAMLLGMCTMTVFAADAPDYSDMSKILNLYNKSVPEDVISFVEYPFELGMGTFLEEGMYQGYNAIRKGGTLKLSNVAESDKYFIYIEVFPLYSDGMGGYSNFYGDEDSGFYGETTFFYTTDGDYDSFISNPIDEPEILKLKKGESVEFKLPEKMTIADGSKVDFPEDTIWLVTANTLHGTYKQADGSTYFSQTEGDTGATNYWFIKADDAAVDAAIAAAGVATPRFVDVKESDYFYAPVEWALEKEITNGTGVNTFSPNATCTQAQILTFLWRANGCPEASAELDWVDNNQYYAGAFKWAVENNLIEGKLDPNAPCTRMDTVKYMYLLETDAEADETLADKFVDVAAEDKAIVAWALEKGVTNGSGVDTFSPNNTCTRGQIVTFLYRAYAK